MENLAVWVSWLCALLTPRIERTPVLCVRVLTFVPPSACSTPMTNTCVVCSCPATCASFNVFHSNDEHLCCVFLFCHLCFLQRVPLQWRKPVLCVPILPLVLPSTCSCPMTNTCVVCSCSATCASFNVFLSNDEHLCCVFLFYHLCFLQRVPLQWRTPVLCVPVLPLVLPSTCSCPMTKTCVVCSCSATCASFNVFLSNDEHLCCVFLFCHLCFLQRVPLQCRTPVLCVPVLPLVLPSTCSTPMTNTCVVCSCSATCASFNVFHSNTEHLCCVFLFCHLCFLQRVLVQWRKPVLCVRVMTRAPLPTCSCRICNTFASVSLFTHYSDPAGGLSHH